MASYALGAYIAAIGTLNVNFFCYPLPGCAVGSVFLADAVVARWINRGARRLSRNPGGKDLSTARRLPIVVGALAGSGLIAISAVSWIANYTQPGDGVAQADQYIASNLPACAIVNASGDSQKYSYLLGGRTSLILLRGALMRSPMGYTIFFSRRPTLLSVQLIKLPDARGCR